MFKWSEEEKAKREYQEYKKNKSIKVNKLNPLTVYYIIRDLSNEEKVKFIKGNFYYIREGKSVASLNDLYCENVDNAALCCYFVFRVR